MSAAQHNRSDCITACETPHGYWWRYTRSKGEPQDTLTAAIIVAAAVAAEEARRRGKTYLVASTPEPTAAVYVFACDHRTRVVPASTSCSNAPPPAIAFAVPASAPPAVTEPFDEFRVLSALLGFRQ